jgi:hypothetical protein
VPARPRRHCHAPVRLERPQQRLGRVGKPHQQLPAYVSVTVQSVPSYRTKTNKGPPLGGGSVFLAVQCTTLTAYNATFNPVLIGSSSGTCQTGYTGTISALCLLNSTTGTTAYFSEPVGTCTRTPASRCRHPDCVAGHPLTIGHGVCNCERSGLVPSKHVCVCFVAVLRAAGPGGVCEWHVLGGLRRHRSVAPAAASVHWHGHVRHQPDQRVHSYVHIACMSD